MASRLSILIFILIGASLTLAHATDPLHERDRYTLRSGDVLDIQYRYTPELNQTVSVLPDGFVNLNLVGDVKVSELTLRQAHDVILEKIKGQLKNPELNLVLKEFQPPYVVVAGEVGKPGRIDIRENTTALQAILLSGGFAPSAQSGQVVLFRKINTDTAEVHILHLSNLHKTSDLERDWELQSGDMLLVPRNKIERISRYMKLLNVGTYINPMQPIP